MAAAIQRVHNSVDAGIKSACRLCSVVRRPILDLRGRVHAYELCFRGDLADDGTEAYNNLLVTVMSFGLERPSELKKLTGKLTAFVRCSTEALSAQLAQVLPASLTILEKVPGV